MGWLRSSAICALLLLVVAPLLAHDDAAPDGEPAQEEDKETNEKQAARRLAFVFRRHPSLRLGNILRVDFRAKVQADGRGFYPYFLTDEGDFELHRTRVGVQGRFLTHFEFEIEREINEEISRAFRLQPESTARPWRDVFVNFRYFRDFQIQAGKFKVPFGMEQLTGPSNLDFVYRSRISAELTPARSIGLMAHGRFFRRGLNYQAGLFKSDGENAEVNEVIDVEGNKEHFYTGVRTFAGRLTGTPLRLLRLPAVIKNIEVGGAFTSTSVPEGLSGLRGRTFGKETIFPHMFVRGERRRLGAEALWTSGPFSVKGEFIHAQEERLAQGIRGDDLPNLVARGWYLSGTWVVTGQKYAERDEPPKNFPFGRGLGAVELAARFEQMRFGSSEHPGRPSRTSRAANVLGNSDRVWTLGTNWYMNRFIKVQANVMREKVEDIQRTPLPGRELFWMRVVRVQFVL